MENTRLDCQIVHHDIDRLVLPDHRGAFQVQTITDVLQLIRSEGWLRLAPCDLRPATCDSRLAKSEVALQLAACKEEKCKVKVKVKSRKARALLAGWQAGGSAGSTSQNFTPHPF